MHCYKSRNEHVCLHVSGSYRFGFVGLACGATEISEHMAKFLFLLVRAASMPHASRIWGVLGERGGKRDRS